MFKPPFVLPTIKGHELWPTVTRTPTAVRVQLQVTDQMSDIDINAARIAAMEKLQASAGLIKQTYLSFRSDADRTSARFTSRAFQIAKGIVGQYTQNGSQEILSIVVDAFVFLPRTEPKPPDEVPVVGTPKPFVYMAIQGTLFVDPSGTTPQYITYPRGGPITEIYDGFPSLNPVFATGYFTGGHTINWLPVSDNGGKPMYLTRVWDKDGGDSTDGGDGTGSTEGAGPPALTYDDINDNINVTVSAATPFDLTTDAEVFGGASVVRPGANESLIHGLSPIVHLKPPTGPVTGLPGTLDTLQLYSSAPVLELIGSPQFAGPVTQITLMGFFFWGDIGYKLNTYEGLGGVVEGPSIGSDVYLPITVFGSQSLSVSATYKGQALEVIGYSVTGYSLTIDNPPEYTPNQPTFIVDGSTRGWLVRVLCKRNVPEPPAPPEPPPFP